MQRFNARKMRVSATDRCARRVGLARTFVIAVALVLGIHPLDAADTWIEIKAPHVTVLANGGLRDARTVAWQLEQIRTLLVKILPWAKVDLDRPFVALAVNNENRMRALVPGYWQGSNAIKPSSVWVSGIDRHYLAIRSDEKAEDRLYINPHVNAYFSYVSLVIRNSLQAEMPLWFSRGLAGVLSNTVVRGSDLLIGPPIPWHLRELRERPRLRLAALVGVTRDSREVAGERLNQFDAQAWALVHFLLFGDEGKRAMQLDRFFNLVSAGATHQAAQVEAFGPIEQLEGEFVSYLRRDLFEFRKLPTDESVRREKFPERSLPATESLATLALFHVSMRQATEARAAIAEARKAGGVLADIHLAEALLLRSEGKEDAVKPALDRAVAEGSTSAYAYYELARLQWQSEPSPESLAAWEKLLRRAAALNPRWSWTFALLADVRSQLGQADAIELATRAVQLAPMESAHRLVDAVVLLRAGQHADAQKAADVALQLATTDEDRQRARELQQAIAQRKPPPTAKQRRRLLSQAEVPFLVRPLPLSLDSARSL